MFIDLRHSYSPESSLRVARALESGCGIDKKQLKGLALEDSRVVYNPVLIQSGKARSMRFVISGRLNRHCSQQWTKSLGAWHLGDRIVKGKLLHRKDIRSLVHSDALITIGSYQYIVGPGRHDIPAPYLVDGSFRGNYRANHRVVKSLGYPKCKKESGGMVSKAEFSTVVGQINNAPVIVQDMDLQVPFFSNQRIVWGHLLRGDNVLDSTQIRQLSGTDIVFRPLTERWIGRSIRSGAFWDALKDEMYGTAMVRYRSRQSKSRNKRDDAWRNITLLQTRDDPSELNCYGLPYAQIGQSIGRTYIDGIEKVFCILGGFTTVGLFTTRSQSNAESRLTSIFKELT